MAEVPLEGSARPGRTRLAPKTLTAALRTSAPLTLTSFEEDFCLSEMWLLWFFSLWVCSPGFHYCGVQCTQYTSLCVISLMAADWPDAFPWSRFQADVWARKQSKQGFPPHPPPPPSPPFGSRSTAAPSRGATLADLVRTEWGAPCVFPILFSNLNTAAVEWGFLK